MRRLRNRSRRELQDIIDNKPPEPRITIAKTPVIAFWCFCGLCFFYSVFNFRDVIADPKLPLLLAALSGLVGVLLVKSRENYFYAFVGCASLVIAIPLFINIAFADRNTTTLKLEIVEKHRGSYKSGPYVDVVYQGREISFGFTNMKEIQAASYVILKVSEGLLGYYVIRDYKLSRR
ncbi:hypothetical protein [Mucilaginibacter pedocola]|nr:hypothetical protein [Mucilaginibacter pedocola]